MRAWPSSQSRPWGSLRLSQRLCACSASRPPGRRMRNASASALRRAEAPADHPQRAEHRQGIGERPVGEAAEAAEVRPDAEQGTEPPRPRLGHDVASIGVRELDGDDREPAPGEPEGVPAGAATQVDERPGVGRTGRRAPGRRPRTGDGRGSSRPPPRRAGACACIPRARRSRPRAAARRGDAVEAHRSGPSHRRSWPTGVAKTRPDRGPSVEAADHARLDLRPTRAPRPRRGRHRRAGASPRAGRPAAMPVEALRATMTVSSPSWRA